MSVYPGLLRRTKARHNHALRRAAFYDFDGTLADLNLVHATLFILANLGEWSGRISYLLGFAARLPMLARAESRDRHLLNIALFEIFKGISKDRLWTLGEEYCERVLMNHLYPHAVEMIEANRAAGTEPVLVTGSPDFIIAPLAERLGIRDFAANRLAFRRGLATGRLLDPVMAGDAKAAWCAAYAEANGVALEASWGYADSHYDLPFLAALGHPVAVNPDRKLLVTAHSRQWPIVRFEKALKRREGARNEQLVETWTERTIDGAAGS
ncbi:MAG: HAD family hydrolase [Candidatus Binataceae bacterium]